MIFFAKINNKIFTILNKLRVYKLKLLGVTIGAHVRLFGCPFIIGDPSKLFIGDNVMINEGVFFNCIDDIVIEKGVVISPRVQFHPGGLIIDEIPRLNHRTEPIIVRQNVWICSGAILNLGVEVGENSVVLPNSVVIRSIPPNVLAGGVPATIVKKINLNLNK